MRYKRILVSLAFAATFIIFLIYQIPEKDRAELESTLLDIPETINRSQTISSDVKTQAIKKVVKTTVPKTTTTLFKSKNPEITGFCRESGFDQGYCTKSPNLCRKESAKYVKDGNRFCPKSGNLDTFACCKKIEFSN